MIEQVREIALGAGQIVIEKLSSGFAVERKGSIDLVTDADLAAEKYIIGQITKLFPKHSICAEEGGTIEKAGEFIWFIDPIDGTTNFAHGFPYFSISLGLVKNNETILGLVYNPVSGECFLAERGSGAFLNDEQIKVSTETKLQNSLLLTGFPYDVATTEKNNLRAFNKATKATQGVRSLGSAALDLCQVACGRFEAFWELSLQPWDLAAGSLIVTEAGGKISNCDGGQFSVRGNEILASNGLIHDELIQTLLN